MSRSLLSFSLLSHDFLPFHSRKVSFFSLFSHLQVLGPLPAGLCVLCLRTRALSACPSVVVSGLPGRHTMQTRAEERSSGTP